MTILACHLSMLDWPADQDEKISNLHCPIQGLSPPCAESLYTGGMLRGSADLAGKGNDDIASVGWLLGGWWWWWTSKKEERH